MTAVPDTVEVESWRTGSTTPRIFTPPLPEHVDLGSEFGIRADSTWGPDCVDLLENVLGWKLLPWQKWLYWRALEKRSDGLGFRFQTTCVVIARQQGKLIDVDELVLTINGFKRMGDLQDGDEVFHPDGHPVKILKAHDIERGRPSYRVTTSDGRTVVAGGEHQWAVQDRRKVKSKGRRGEKPVRTYPWEVLTTDEIMARGLQRQPNRTTKNDYAFRLPRQHRLISKPVDLPIDPYVLGMWLGDGNSKGARISVGWKDVGDVAKLLTEAGASVSRATRGKTCWSLNIVTGPMRQGFESQCRKLGIWGDKKVPKIYLEAGTEQRQALLAGLLDSDGHITSIGQVEFCNTNWQLAESVLYLARSLGYRATLGESVATLYGKECGPKYRVQFTPSDNPFRLARKADGVKTEVRGDRTAISIASIEPVDSRLMRCITVDSEDGRWLVGLDLIPTHNTQWLRGLGIWRLFLSETGESTPTCPGAKLAIIAAQSLSYAELTLKEVVDDIRDNPLLKRELVNHRVVNGGHNAQLTNDRTWRAVTATRKGGRSLSVDLAVLDELREFTNFDGWNALTHATTARSNAQIVAASNAGDSRSVVLRSIRDAAIRKILADECEGTQLGFFEWSVPPEADPRDRTQWHKANPSLGVLNNFTIETLEGFLEVEEHNNMAGFRTESLCQWVNALQAGIIPAEAWEKTLDPDSKRNPKSPIFAAVDVSYERDRAYIAVASRRTDGMLHTEVVAAAPGTDWVVPWLTARAKNFVGVAVQEIGAPASQLIDELERAQVPVVRWGPAREVQAGCGLFYDAIVEGTVFHRPAPVLDRAATSGSARHSGDSWIFDRRNSPVDVAPLIAVTAAVWLEAGRGAAPKDPQVHSWDEEKISQWENESRTRWGINS